MKKNGCLIFIEDDENARRGIAEILTAEGYEVLAAANRAEALRIERQCRPDLIVTDLRLPDGDGLETALEIRRRHPDLPVLVVTAHGSIRSAVDAMKKGADGYLTKPLDFDELLLSIERALTARRMREENRRLRAVLNARFSFDHLVGTSTVWRTAIEAARHAAVSDSPVLLTGESGTGKELVAHAVHHASRRANGPFVAVNCAAIPRDLLENEFFGHEAGAFTGAVKRLTGKFETAHGGAIFLDEIGEMPAPLQAKLLRVLQEKSFTRLGGTVAVHSDFRIIASTHRDLPALVREGNFRQDLFFRLNVLTVRLPSLRERRADVPLLLDHFLDRNAVRTGAPSPEITGAARMRLERYDWPGNVRELENVAERLCVLAPGEKIDADRIEWFLGAPSAAGATPEGEPPDFQPLPEAVRALEERMIRHALAYTDGHRTRAANLLGVSLRTLQYRIKQLGIE